MSISKQSTNKRRSIILMLIGILVGFAIGLYIVFHVEELFGISNIAAAKIGFTLFVTWILSNLVYKLIKRIRS